MYLYFHYLRLLVRSFFRLILISLLHLYVFIKIIITFYIDSDCIRYTTYMYSYLVVWIMNLWQGVIIGYKSTHKLSPDNLRLYLTLYSRSIGYIAGCMKHERVFVVTLISMVIKLILGFYYLYLDHVLNFFFIWYIIWYSFIHSMLSLAVWRNFSQCKEISLKVIIRILEMHCNSQQATHVYENKY